MASKPLLGQLTSSAQKPKKNQSVVETDPDRRESNRENLRENGRKPQSRLVILKLRTDFLKLMKNGHRLRPMDWLLLNYAHNLEGQMRCGWTLPRQVGPAVVRNRLKRWSRVYFRDLVVRRETLPIDINLVFRKAEDDFYKKLKYEQFAQVLDRSWEQIRRRQGPQTSSSSTRPIPIARAKEE